MVVVNLLSIGCRAMIIGAAVRAVLVRGDVGVADRRITRTPQSTGDRRFASALSTIGVDELDPECGWFLRHDNARGRHSSPGSRHWSW